MKYILLIIFFSLTAISAFPQFSVGGTELYEVKGKDDIRIFYLQTSSGAYAEYVTTASSVKFFKFSTGGRTEVPSSDISVSGNTYRISNLEDMHGYVSQEDGGSDLFAIWIIDYSLHLPVFNSLEVLENEDTDTDCDTRRETLHVDKTEDQLFYCSPSYQTLTTNLQRIYKVEYEDAEWDNRLSLFNDTTIIKDFTGTQTKILSPLKNTSFIVKDKIAENLGLNRQVESAEFHAVRVDPHPKVVQITEEGEVPLKTDDEGNVLAPARLKFYGYSNDATLYYAWRIYQNNDMENYIIMYTDQDFEYTFNQAGTFRITFEAASSRSVCVKTEDAETINIADSYLDVPNYFSPGDSPRVNDEFKVKHKSLIKFKCTIFNRWGNKLYQFDDPDKGWDGRYNGKLVNPGVYFYVIEATGSDGIKYKKAGDINILRSK